MDEKFKAGTMAVEDCVRMLKACGYSLKEYGGDHTGCRYEMRHPDGAVVVLEVKEG